MTIRFTVRIHAALAELPSAIKLWYMLRLLDRAGCGHVTTTLEELSEGIGLSIPTIKRYIRQGQQMKLYRAINKQWGQGKITFYLSSLFEVCRQHGIVNWGACTDAYASELKYLRLFTTQATAQRLQRCSRYKAKQKHKSVDSPKNLLEPSSSEARDTTRGGSEPSAGGRILQRTGRFIYATNDFPQWGGSQKTVGEKVGRADRTVRHRLSNCNRRKKGVPTIDRIQVVKKIADLSDPSLFQQMLSEGFRGIIGTRKGSGKITVWTFCPNVYAEDLQLFSQRQLRARFAKLLEQALTFTPPKTARSVQNLEFQSESSNPKCI